MVLTIKRAAIYGSAGVLLVAYLAVANSAPPQDRDVAPHRAALRSTASADAIARDMQTEAARLQERLRTAPVPPSSPRNPFAFGAADRSLRSSDVAHTTVADTPDLAPAPSIPALSLIGMAEDTASKGTVRRTAVVAGDGDAIYFVAEGDVVIGRYRVTRIGADAIELQDLITQGYRRLAMK